MRKKISAWRRSYGFRLSAKAKKYRKERKEHLSKEIEKKRFKKRKIAENGSKIRLSAAAKASEENKHTVSRRGGGGAAAKKKWRIII